MPTLYLYRRYIHTYIHTYIRCLKNIIINLYTLTIIFTIILTSCSENSGGPQYFTNVKTVSAGRSHTVAIKDDGTLWTWGNNDYGQLGDGTYAVRNLPVQIGTENDWKAVSAGYNHTVAIKGNGELWGWGENYCGKLGSGLPNNNPKPVKIGSVNDWKAVSAGWHHTVAIKGDGGELRAWGYNTYAQLGNGTTTDSSTPVNVLEEEVPHAHLTGVKAISTLYNRSVAIKGEGELWEWGVDSSKLYAVKVLESGSHFTGVGTISAGRGHTVAIKDGVLWAWGSNTYGQFGNGTLVNKTNPVPIGDGYKAVSAGEYHTVAIKDDGSLWAWGRNHLGQLGDGTFANNPDPVQIGDGYKAVSAGYYHTVAIKDDGSLWAWGSNNLGQLGDGTLEGRFIPRRVLQAGD